MSVLVVAEPGGFQVQAALQPQSGGLADGAVVVQPGQFGVLGGVQGASQLPVGQPVRFRGLIDRELRRVLNAAEHAELARLYDDGTITQATRQQLQRSLDLEATRLSDDQH